MARRFALLGRRASPRSYSSSGSSLMLASMGSLVSSCSLFSAGQLRMPSSSSFARREVHTRAGGSTSAGSWWAAETILRKPSLPRLPGHARAPRGSDARPSRWRATCTLLCCMAFHSTGRTRRLLLPVDPEFLRRISALWGRTWAAPNRETYRLQAAAAAAILWKVELATS
jgi:hypothetical protein